MSLPFILTVLNANSTPIVLFDCGLNSSSVYLYFNNCLTTCKYVIFQETCFESAFFRRRSRRPRRFWRGNLHFVFLWLLKKGFPTVRHILKVLWRENAVWRILRLPLVAGLRLFLDTALVILKQWVRLRHRCVIGLFNKRNWISCFSTDSADEFQKRLKWWSTSSAETKSEVLTSARWFARSNRTWFNQQIGPR